MRIALIAALDKNRAIGRANALPWNIPEDLSFFKQKTVGKAVIMGRKTFQSIGRPLPNRLNIVVTRNPDKIATDDDMLATAGSVAEAVDIAREWSVAKKADEIMVIGGGEIYTQALGIADRLYLTHVHTAIDGADAWFPEWQKKGFSLVQKTENKNTDFSFDFCEYAKS